jgi:hypothetical protein
MGEFVDEKEAIEVLRTHEEGRLARGEGIEANCVARERGCKTVGEIVITDEDHDDRRFRFAPLEFLEELIALMGNRKKVQEKGLVAGRI